MIASTGYIERNSLMPPLLLRSFNCFRRFYSQNLGTEFNSPVHDGPEPGSRIEIQCRYITLTLQVYFCDCYIRLESLLLSHGERENAITYLEIEETKSPIVS